MKQNSIVKFWSGWNIHEERRDRPIHFQSNANRWFFLIPHRYSFDPHDHVELCTCIKSDCNSSRHTTGNGPANVLLAISILILLSMLAMASTTVGDGTSTIEQKWEGPEEEEMEEEKRRGREEFERVMVLGRRKKRMRSVEEMERTAKEGRNRRQRHY